MNKTDDPASCNSKSVMQSYIRSRTGCRSRRALDAWQIRQVRESVLYACRHSAWYKQHLKGIDAESICTYDDLKRIPLTPSEVLRERPQDFLCIPASRVDRIVTLHSSGTTGKPKRIFFTASELEKTIDFFQHGMRTLADPGDTVMILFPCDTPDGIGDLLARGLSRAHITAVPQGPVADIGATCKRIIETESNVLVGIPVQVLALAEYIGTVPVLSGQIHIKNVLLSADTTPASLVRRVGELLHCDVYTHFGMTEAGYGVAIDCAAHAGLHIREEALLIEVIDPESGKVLPQGEQGEFVLTTFSREAMPLIRYRTGDLGYLTEDVCACRSFVKRMVPCGGRMESIVRLGGGTQIRQWELDEIVFDCPHVVDYNVKDKDGLTQLTAFGVRLTHPGHITEALSKRLSALSGAGDTVPIGEDIKTGFCGTGVIKRHPSRDI